MKDDDGQVVEFEDDEPAEAAPTVVKKKKVKTTKTAKAALEQASSQMIEAEDTLAMIKNALKSGNAETTDSGKKVKKVKKKEKLPKLEDNTEEATQD